MWAVFGFFPRGVRMAGGCDGSPEVARVSAGSTGRPGPRVVGTGWPGSAGAGQSWCGQLLQAGEGLQGEGGERSGGGQVQEPTATGARVPGREREQP
jgi:hypothetical protein